MKIFKRFLANPVWTPAEAKAWVEKSEDPKLGFHEFAKLIEELQAATGLKITELHTTNATTEEPEADAEENANE